MVILYVRRFASTTTSNRSIYRSYERLKRSGNALTFVRTCQKVWWRLVINVACYFSSTFLTKLHPDRKLAVNRTTAAHTRLYAALPGTANTLILRFSPELPFCGARQLVSNSNRRYEDCSLLTIFCYK